MLNNSEKKELSSLEKIEKIKFLLNKEDCDLLEILELKNNITFPNLKEESKLNEEIWNKQFDLLFNEKITLSSTNHPSMLLINHLLNQAYDYNVKDINKINYLESLREDGLKIIKEIKKSKNIDEIERIKKNSEDLNINLSEYFIKRTTKIKAAQIREENVESSDMSSAEKTIERKCKKFKKRKKKEEDRENKKEMEIVSFNDDNGNDIHNKNNIIDLSNFDNDNKNNYINTRSCDKKIGTSDSPPSHTINLSDIDEDSMEVEEVIQIEERKKRKRTKEVQINENEEDEEEDIIIEEEINEKKNNNDVNNINSKNNLDDEEINKILNKKTKRNNTDFHIYKDSSYNSHTFKNNKLDINRKKDYHENRLFKQKNIIVKHSNEKNRFNTNKMNSNSMNHNNKYNIKESRSENKNNIKNGLESIDKKSKIRKNALLNITKLLNDNEILKAQGEKFINNLAKKVEDDLAKAHPGIDYEYQKTLMNMNKTLKEIAKYKNVSQKIINQKCSLFKIAKFNYGEKFVQKLKKVNDGQKIIKDKKNNFLLNKEGILQYPRNLQRNNNNSTFNVIKKDEKKINNNIEKSGKYSPTQQNLKFIKESSKFEADDLLYKNNNKDSSENYEETKVKFSPTKSFPPMKKFNSINTNGIIEEGVHLYEPITKDKIRYKVFIPILFDPKYNYDLDDKSNSIIKETKQPQNYKNTFIVKKQIEENNNNNIQEDNNINNNNTINSKNEDFNNIKDNNKDKNNILKDIDMNINKEKNNISIPPPMGSVLRIFHGKIVMNHNYIKNVSLFSTNKYQKIIKFPIFDKELLLPSKAKTTEVIPYCIKHLTNKSRIIIFGWLEPDLTKMNEIEKEIEINKFKDLINEFDKKDKCSCLINKRVKLYIFVLNNNNDDFNSKIISKCDFYNEKIKENLNKVNKYLIFVMLTNISDLNNEEFKEKIKPEIISIKKSNDNEKSDSEEESSNNEIEEESYKNNENKKDAENEEDDENIKLKKLFSQKDFDVNSYAEKNFKNLTFEEMKEKLNKLNDENRAKLAEIFKKYSESHQSQGYMNEEKEENNLNSEKREENINNNITNNSSGILPNIYMSSPIPMNIAQTNSNLINQYYMNQFNAINNPNIKNTNMNLNINNSINNSSLLYYNQLMNLFGRNNQNI